MFHNLRKTVNAFTLNHLYALLLGLVVFIYGWFLFDHVTDTQGLARDLREYRPYGFGLMWVAGLFVWLVIRDARKQSEQ
jgi:hypothetical protein